MGYAERANPDAVKYEKDKCTICYRGADKDGKNHCKCTFLKENYDLGSK